MDNNKPVSIGALWANYSKRTGAMFYSGNIEVNGEKIDVICFVNSNKKNLKQPDINICLSTPRPQSNVQEEENNQASLNSLAASDEYPSDDSASGGDVPF